MITASASLFFVALAASCASMPGPAVATAPAPELPAGQGRTILQASCTSCHDLSEVTKFRGFYNRQQWRDVVVTMVEYGAAVEMDDVEVLADYLAQHLGKR